MGDLSGLVYAKKESLDALNGCRFYADDVLGKHSEIDFRWGRDEYTPDITENDLLEGVKIPEERLDKDEFGVHYVAGFPFTQHLNFEQEE